MQRQGDVLLVKSEIPAGAGPAKIDTRAKGIVLAYGEQTGHLHSVEAEEGVKLFLLEKDGKTFLRVEGGDAYLRHGGLGKDGRVVPMRDPEHFDEVVKQGSYEVVRQVTWTMEEVREVAD